MELEAVCNYCGNEWVIKRAFTANPKDVRCPVCSDKSIKFKKLEDKFIDYYQGCPPFPERNEIDNRDEYPDMFDYSDYL